MNRSETEPGRVSEIAPKEYAERQKWAGRLKQVFRSEIVDKNNSLKLAEEASRRGEAVLVVSTHFSKLDPLYAMLMAAGQKEMAKTRFLSPIALHQDRRILHWLGDKTGVKIMDIATKNTLKRDKYKNHKLNEGEEEFYNATFDSIRRGETIFISAQAEREPRLGEEEKPTMGMLIRELEQQNIRNYCILFVGFEIKGTKDYSKKSGFNILNKYTMNIGSCLSSREILERASEMEKNTEIFSKKRKSLTRCVNHVAYEELRKAVPPEYR